MPAFLPFHGIRFAAHLDAAAVTAPPYDVIDDAQRTELVARSDRNTVLLDLPAESEGPERYQAAGQRFTRWRDDGTLVTDERPTLTLYRMTYRDDQGRSARTLGAIGALALSRPDEGLILPHEHTTPKARTDRLELMRTTCANLSPIWVLSPAEGLTELLEPEDEPDAAWSDDDGVEHATWRLDDPTRIAAIGDLVAGAPVVVADGHHRYETALAHRDERRAATGSDEELASDLLMALVVELSDHELCVRPIHRLVDGPDAAQVLDALVAQGFSPGPTLDPGELSATSTATALAEAGGVAVVDASGGATVAVAPDDERDVPDTVRLAEALAGLDPQMTYHHDPATVARAVAGGAADAGVLVRPATVSQIRHNARIGERMPPKTTFFHPKPRTGVVFRAC